MPAAPASAISAARAEFFPPAVAKMSGAFTWGATERSAGSANCRNCAGVVISVEAIGSK